MLANTEGGNGGSAGRATLLAVVCSEDPAVNLSGIMRSRKQFLFNNNSCVDSGDSEHFISVIYIILYLVRLLSNAWL